MFQVVPYCTLQMASSGGFAGAHVPHPDGLQSAVERVEAVQGIVGKVRPGAVAALAGDGHIEGEVARGGGTVQRGDLPCLQPGGHVQGVAGVHPDMLCLQIAQDELQVVAALFAPLKAQNHPARQLRLVLAQDLGGGEQHGGVGVVSAGVGHAGHLGDGAALGLLGIVRGLLHGQRVHVSPQQDRAAPVLVT